MKILIVSQTYAPEPDIRYHVLAQQLVERGHEVQVLTAFPNYPEGRFYDGYPVRLWRREDDRGAHVLRLPHMPDHSRSGLRRAVSYGSFAASAAILGPFLTKQVDLVFAHHPPLSSGYAGWWLSSLRRVPFVLEIQDIWPDTLAATGMMREGRLLRSIGWAAGFIYRRAKAITVTSPGFKRLLVERGVPEEKVHLIYNWVDDAVFGQPAPDPALANEAGMSDRFNIVYAGNLGAAQDLRNVLHAAKLLADLDRVQFVFIGDGTERALLDETARSEGLTNVRFLPRQPMERMPAYYALADATLVHLRDDPLFEITIPGKTQSCLSAGKPILACVKGDAADLVARAKAGICVKPNDPQDLARAVRELYGMTDAAREEMGTAGHVYFEQHLTHRILMDRYEELFSSLVARRTG